MLDYQMLSKEIKANYDALRSWVDFDSQTIWANYSHIIKVSSGDAWRLLPAHEKDLYSHFKMLCL
jgi:hypothetical protein